MQSWTDQRSQPVVKTKGSYVSLVKTFSTNAVIDWSEITTREGTVLLCILLVKTFSTNAVIDWSEITTRIQDSPSTKFHILVPGKHTDEI
jgi:hypothetical protein